MQAPRQWAWWQGKSKKNGAGAGGQVPPGQRKKNAQPRLGVYIGGIKCLVADSPHHRNT